MNSFPAFETLDMAQKWLVDLVMQRGHRTSPRGLSTLEIQAAGFKLINPRARFLSYKHRRWSLPLAIGEFCWHTSASDEVDFLSWYAKRWREFSDDLITIRGSCYGKRVFACATDGKRQWDRVMMALRCDPNTRRAILYFVNPGDLGFAETKDFPCAVSLQFLVKEGKLDAITTMRSNDALMGLPYDVFLFTMLQELMACQVGLPLGSYYHFANSLHIYESDLVKSQQISNSLPTIHEPMPQMAAPNQLKSFLAVESDLRKSHSNFSVKFDALHKYWADLGSVLIWFRQLRVPTKSKASQLSTENMDEPYRGLLRLLTLAI